MTFVTKGKIQSTCFGTPFQEHKFAPDMEKENFLTQARFNPKLFYPKKCKNFDKSEFATKQRKMYEQNKTATHL